MGYFTISKLVFLVWVGMTNGYPCSAPNGKQYCLEPHCIETTANILRVMDRGADPCQDFYQYACGNFAQVIKRPQGQSRWTTFREIQRQNQEIVQKLLEKDGYDYKGVRSEALVKAKTFFQTCMNQTFEVEKGIGPLLQLIDSVGGWTYLNSSLSSPAPLASRAARIYKLGINLLFAMNIGADDKNSSLNIIYFEQSGLSLYRPASYVEPSRRLQPFLEEGTRVLTLLREAVQDADQGDIEAEARRRMEDIIQFETKMSEVFVPSEKLRDIHSIYNKMTLEKLAATMPDFDMLGYLREVFDKDLGNDREVVVYTPSYFRKLNDVIQDTPARVLEDYSMLLMTRRYLKYLPQPYRDAEEDYVRAVSGTQERPPLLDQCLKEIERNFGMVTGALFVEEKFSPEHKKRVEEMLSFIQDRFFEHLPKVSWLDNKAKLLAKEKFEAMKFKVGFPDFILEPSKLDEYFEHFEVSRDSALLNQANYKRALLKEALTIVDLPVDKDTWDITPAKAGAQYDFSRNEATIPSGILQPPFFGSDLPTSMVFGAIGMIIGREITHGFDTNGQKYDKDGVLRASPLWDSSTSTDKMDCFVSQYSKYLVGGQNVDGEFTLKENIADNGGLKIAYLAYQKWRKHNADELSLPLNLTASQEFFLGMGQVWCSDYTPEAAQNYLQSDFHTPEKYRVIGSLSNLPAFNEAFHCAEGTPMNPAEKCEYW